VSGGFKPLHPAFPLAGRLVRIFRPIIEVAVLPMFHTGQDLAFGRPVAPQLIGNDDPWDIRWGMFGIRVIFGHRAISPER
jgi:hypothetical protein